MMHRRIRPEPPGKTMTWQPNAVTIAKSRRFQAARWWGTQSWISNNFLRSETPNATGCTLAISTSRWCACSRRSASTAPISAARASISTTGRREIPRSAQRLRRVRASAAIIRWCATPSSRCSTPNCPIWCRWTSRRSPAFSPSGCSRYVPYLDKVFFANSGAETVEAALKFARAATGRTGIVYCSHAFHGLTYGALSLNGDKIFRNGFEPLLPDCVEVPFNDLAALERALVGKTRRRLRRRADPGQGRHHAGRRLSQIRAGAVPQIRHAVRRRRSADRHGPHRALPRLRALGRRARHGAAGEIAVRRLRAVGRAADAQMDLTTRCSTAWTAPSSMARPSPRTISPWRRGWPRSRSWKTKS